MAVQWLGLHAFTAECPGSIPGRGTKIPQAAWLGQRGKKKAMGGLCFKQGGYIIKFML